MAWMVDWIQAPSQVGLVLLYISYFGVLAFSTLYAIAWTLDGGTTQRRLKSRGSNIAPKSYQSEKLLYLISSVYGLVVYDSRTPCRQNMLKNQRAFRLTDTAYRHSLSRSRPLPGSGPKTSIILTKSASGVLCVRYGNMFIHACKNICLWRCSCHREKKFIHLYAQRKIIVRNVCVCMYKRLTESQRLRFQPQLVFSMASSWPYRIAHISRNCNHTLACAHKKNEHAKETERARERERQRHFRFGSSVALQIESREKHTLDHVVVVIVTYRSAS